MWVTSCPVPITVSLNLLATNLVSPLLCFVLLGVVAAGLRSDLSFPEGRVRLETIGDAGTIDGSQASISAG